MNRSPFHSTAALLAFLALTASATARAQGPVGPASDPENTQGWVLNTSLSDEFNGESLDSSKWIPRHSYYGGPPPGAFAPQNVSVGGGYLRLRSINHNLLRNGDFEYGDLRGWAVSPQEADAGLFANDTGQRAPQVYRDWKYSLRMTGAGEVRQVVTGLSPNTQYKFAAYGYLAEGAPTLRIGVRNYGGPELATTVTATAYPPTWTTTPTSIHLFTTGSGQTSAEVFISVLGAGTVYVDEASLVPRTLPNGVTLHGSTYVTLATAGTPSADPENPKGPGIAHYGYYEARMKVADAHHRSNFWLQGGEVPLGYSEIDIHEIVGSNRHRPFRDNIIFTTVHYYPGGWANDDAWHVPYNTGVRQALDFHVYGADWTAEKIDFFYDGELYATYDNRPEGDSLIDQPMFIFLNTGTTAYPGLPEDGMDSEFLVDYLRVWQMPDSGSTSVAQWSKLD